MFCSTLFQRSFIPPRSGLPHATRVRKVQSREQHTKLREEVQRAPFARVAFVLSMRDKLFALGVRPRVTSFVMEIVSSCPMRVHGFTWQLKSGAFAQTIIAKATFLLEPGHAKLALEKDRIEIHERDVFVKVERHEILRAPSDQVPYKRRVDVLLVGHAYAPGKQPVRSLVTQLRVGDFSKAIEVICDRGFRTADEHLIEGPHFTKMPLDWTHAAGGPNTTNPVGRHVDSPPDAFGLRSAPNLQHPRTFVNKGLERIAPIGYGPIAPTWQDRTVCLEDLAPPFSPDGWEKRPLPEHFDFDYFQAAPADQQIAELRADETLVLEHLHPLHAHLTTRLPGIIPRAVVHRSSGEREDVTLVADTLWIDADRGICTVVWRGTVGLNHADEAGIIGVALLETVEPNAESAENNLIETIPEGLIEDDELAQMTMIAPFAKPKGPAMPFVQANLAERPANPVRSNDDGALPFGPVGLSALPPAPIARGQITLPAQSPTSSPTIPVAGLVAPQGDSLRFGAQTNGGVTEQSVGSLVRRNGLSLPHETPSSGAAVADMRVAFTEPDAPTEPTREPLQLLWSDRKTMARMRSSDAWRAYFQAQNEDFFDVLHKAPRTNVARLSEMLDAAYGANGRFEAPLVVLTADMELPFDELEALKAAMSAAIPLLTAKDEALEAAVSGAKTFVQTPGLSASPEVCASLTQRIREAFIKEKPILPADYLEKQMERVLLLGRHHQRRDVFGETHVRVLLWFSGENSPQIGYLPAHVAPDLPLWKRLQMRLLAEVHAAQDEYEPQTLALKIVAVARVGHRRRDEFCATNAFPSQTM